MKVALTRPNGRQQQLAAVRFVNACERAAAGVCRWQAVNDSDRPFDRSVDRSVTFPSGCRVRWSRSDGPSVSLVVAASRGGSEHGLTLNSIDRLAQRLCRHAAHGGIEAFRTRRSLSEGVGHRVVETQ